MKIKSIDITGYGAYNQYRIDDLAPGMTVFLGHNEAGKSTLLAFIRAVLFGFPSKKYAHARYEPLLGGSHGGALVIEDETGLEYRVERGGGSSSGSVKVFMPDGSVGDEKTLQRLLHHTSQTLFEHVFAFGLGELQRIETLQDDEVSSFIYSAGMAAGRLSIPEVEKHLSNKQTELFKPNGRTQPINTLINDLQATDRKLKELQADAGQHASLHDEWQRLSGKIESLEEQASSLKQHEKWLSKLLQAHSLFEEQHQLQHHIQSLPDIPFFPEEGVQRLESLEQQLLASRIEITTLETDRQRVRLELESLPQTGVWLSHRPLIDLLYADVNVVSDRMQHISALQQQLLSIEDNLAGSLLRLGPRCNEQTLIEFDASLAEKERIREFKLTHQAIQEERQTETAHFEHLGRQLEDVKENLKDCQERVNQSKIDRSIEEIQEKRTLLRQLRTEVYSWRDTHTQIKAINRLIDGKRQELHVPRREQPAAYKRVSIALLLVGLMIISASIVSFLSEKSGMSNMVAWIELIAGIALGWFSTFGRKGVFPDAIRLQDSNSSEVEQLNKLSMERESLVQALDQKNSKIHRYTHTLQIELQPDQSEESVDAVLNKLETRFEHDHQAATRYAVEVQEYNRLTQSFDQLQTRADDAEKRFEHVSSRLLQAQDQWREFLSKRGLPEDLSFDGYVEVFETIVKAKEILRERERVNKQLQEALQKNQVFIDQIQHLVDVLQHEVRSQDPLLQIRDLHQELQAATERDHHKKGITHTLSALEDRWVHANSQTQRIKEDITALCMKAGTEDPETFRSLAPDYQQRQSFLTRIRELESNLRAIVGDEEEWQKLSEEWSKADPLSLQQESDTLQQQYQSLIADRDLCKEEQGSIKQRITALEKDGTISDWRLRKEEQLTQVQTLSREWAKFTLCRSFIRQSRDMYERERQPSLLRRASTFFEMLTEGRYVKVIAPTDEQRLVVQHQDGRILDTPYLSRGTAEQLYLSMRLSLAEEYARLSPLPLVLDDIFVNFDSIRLRAALRLLADVSERHQILLFTCHEYVQDAILEYVPNTEARSIGARDLSTAK